MRWRVFPANLRKFHLTERMNYIQYGLNAINQIYIQNARRMPFWEA